MGVVIFRKHGLPRFIPVLPTGLVPLLLSVAALEGMIGLFAAFYWGHGLLRLGLLIGLLLGAAVLHATHCRAIQVSSRWQLPASPWPYLAALPAFLAVATAGGILSWGSGTGAWFLACVATTCMLAIHQARRAAPQRLGEHPAALVFVMSAVLLMGLQSARVLAWTVDAANRTNHLRLDEGRTTWRAAQHLLRGENPYARGVIVDDTAFERRLERRRALGLGPSVAPDAIRPVLDRYLQSPDPALGRQLLPETAGEPIGTRFEAAVVGYKYGPVPFLLTAGLQPWFGPSAVPLTNGLACFALFAVVAMILRPPARIGRRRVGSCWHCCSTR